MSSDDEKVWLINIVKLIIHNNGNLPAKTINQWVQDNCKGARRAPSIYNIIARNLDTIFCIDDSNIKTSNVSVKTSADLCTQHWSRQGCSNQLQCDKIHICKYKITSQCNKPVCPYGHNFESPQNLMVLRKHGIDYLSNDDLFKLFQTKEKGKIPKVCQHYNKDQCKFKESCDSLHLCYHFVLGDCTFGQRCKLSHSLLDGQPCNVLNKLGWKVQNNPENVLLAIRNNIDSKPQALLTTTPTKPKICTFYNKPTPECQKDLSCPAMHVCRYYLSENCTFGQRCNKSHNIFDKQPKALLEKHGWDVARSPKAVLKELQERFIDNNEANMNQVTPSNTRPNTTNQSGARPKEFSSAKQQKPAPVGEENSVPKICTYNLSTKCNFGSKCHNLHCKRPYHWQYADNCKGEIHWISFTDEDNDSIEMCYCDVHNEDCYAKIMDQEVGNIIFDERVYVIHKLSLKGQVRRLGTDSWGDSPLSKPFVTKWLWYWKDELGKWREYGKQVTSSESASELSSRDIEEKYMSEIPEIQFKAGKNSYTLDLKSMEQRNQKYGTIRKVRRRPLYSSEDKKIEGGRIMTADSRYSEISFPKHWDTDMVSNDPGYQLVKVSKRKQDGSKNTEYYDIKKLFVATMSNYHIKKLTRIQNYELWEEYTRKKEKMKKASSDGSVLEKQLFHGTRSEYIDAISQQGFDWRVTGSSSGTAYGKGSYFARDANYSRNYTNCGKMFVVKVLVGQYTTGKSTMVRPPPKNPANPYTNLYDSCVNSMSDPQIYVLFEKSQSYPEYIIEFDSVKVKK